MITSAQLKSVTDLRNAPGSLLNAVRRNFRPIGIVRHNKLEAYLADARTFEALQEAAEDGVDRFLVKSRLKNASDRDFVPYHP